MRKPGLNGRQTEFRILTRAQNRRGVLQFQQRAIRSRTLKLFLWNLARSAVFSGQVSFRRNTMLGTILLVILILLLIGALPSWGYSSGWGYGPSGILGVVLVVFIVLLLAGRV